MPEGLPFILGFLSPSFAFPHPSPAVFSSSRLFSAEVSKEGLGHGEGAYKLKGIGPYSAGLVHRLHAFVPWPFFS